MIFLWLVVQIIRRLHAYEGLKYFSKQMFKIDRLVYDSGICIHF